MLDERCLKTIMDNGMGTALLSKAKERLIEAASLLVYEQEPSGIKEFAELYDRIRSLISDAHSCIDRRLELREGSMGR